MMTPTWLTTPLKLIPTPFTAVTLGVVLNLFFKRHPDLKERMRELSGKRFLFDVEDLNQQFFMEVSEEVDIQIHTSLDDPPHVTMAGESRAFLLLLLQKSDPDALFFSRRLKLSGETETGLRFKNILDNIELDWEQELSALMGEMPARAIFQILESARGLGQRAHTHFEEGMDQWLYDSDVPRKEDLERLQADVDLLTAEEQQLSGRISRLEKRHRVCSR